MTELQRLTCILDIPYVRRPPAIDPFYGPDHVELRLDVLGPDPLPTAPTPTVMRIDGCPGWGPGWRSAGIGPASNSMLARAGYLTVSVSVRHSKQATYPAQLEDTHTAIRWLRDNPLNLPIDSDRIGIWGQSAGGHLAALAALTGARVRAAVTMSGPSDFLSPDWPRPDAPVILDLFGGDIHSRRELMRHASPVTHAHPDAPPLLIMHGTRDETVPFDQAERLHHAMRRAGAQSHLVPVTDAHHNLRSDPRTPGDIPMPGQVEDVVIDFFNDCLTS